jgi:6-phospho-3-hexuloisomerase
VEIKRVTRAPLVVAGGIDGEGLKRLAEHGVYAAIVGRAITESEDPLDAARKLRSQVGAAAGAGQPQRPPIRTSAMTGGLPRNIQDASRLILGKLAEVQPQIDALQSEALVQAIEVARRVFVYGAGRTGLMVRAFAYRLAHLGIPTYILGEPGVPPMAAGDLFVVASSSGETVTPLAAARRARELGIRVAAVLSNRDSSLGQIADPLVVLTSRKGDMAGLLHVTSRQPMGSLVEQSMLLFFDALVLRLMEKMGQGSREMHTRHSNVE